MSSVEIYRHYKPEQRIKWLNVKDNPPSTNDGCCYLCYSKEDGYPWWSLCLYKDDRKFHMIEEFDEWADSGDPIDDIMPAKWYVPLDRFARPVEGANT